MPSVKCFDKALATILSMVVFVVTGLIKKTGLLADELVVIGI